MKITVDIHGTEEEITVLVDTGFTTGTGFGLKLSSNYLRYTIYTGTGRVNLADGSEVAKDSIPDAKIIKIEDHRLEDEVTLPTIFMDGPNCIGVMFLQQYILKMDGPDRLATIEFEI